MIVIADTTPLNYLALLGHLDILPRLYGSVIVPQAVMNEMQDEQAPSALQAWLSTPPAWLVIGQIQTDDAFLRELLDDGEREAILLAEELQADLLLMDERNGRAEAGRRGLNVTGTIGILSAAAERGLLGFPEAIARLRQTNFRISTALLQPLLDRFNQ